MSLPLSRRYVAKAVTFRRSLVQSSAYWQWTEIRGLRSASMDQQVDYSKWNPEDLIARVTALEHQLEEQTAK